MTGREFLEADTPQQRLFLERFKRMEIIQKIFNELPKADHVAVLYVSNSEQIPLVLGTFMCSSLDSQICCSILVATLYANLCNHGSYFLAANSSLCGLAGNNFFRNILHVRQAAFISALPMAVIPFISTAAVYEVFVREPLFSGELSCEVCTVVRGGLIGAAVGGLYPVFLALPMNASLAARYSSSPLPGKENMFRFWLTVAQPVFRKMSWAVLVQALTGIYLATKHHGIYIKILEQMNTRRDPEELEA